jgi:hypothetical protein
VPVDLREQVDKGRLSVVVGEGGLAAPDDAGWPPMVQERSQRELEALVAQKGWPRVGQVGREAAAAGPGP